MMHAAISNLVRTLVVSILLGLGLYVGVIVATGVHTEIRGVGQIGVAGWSLVLGLSLVNFALRYLRWRGYLVRLGERVPLRRDIAYYLAGFAFSPTPGKVGEAVRSLYLKRHNVDFTHSLSALFVERLMDVVTMALLALIAVWFYKSATLHVLIVVALFLLLLPLVHHPALERSLDRFAHKFPSERVATSIQHVRSLLKASAKLLKTKILYGALVIGVLAWGAQGVGLWVVLEYLNAPTPLFIAVGIYAAGMLAGALSFIPGGLGSTEAVIVLLLGLSGIEPTTGLAATLICRIATFWFAVAIGVAAMSGLEIGGIHLLRKKAEAGVYGKQS